MEQQIIANGGLQIVPQIAVPQIVYLDFDGEMTSYNGEILTVDNVNVSASGYDQKSISLIIGQLNDIYSGDLFFTDSKPGDGEYSTVYIGKSNFLSEYASIQGISETIDVGNKIKNDNAFVFLDSSSDIGYTTHVIAHEIGHIVYGDTHSGQQHNPYNQTTAYQYYSVVGNINSKNNVSVKAENTGIKSLPLVIDPALKEYCYVTQLLADMTKLYGEYYDLVYKQQYYQQIYAYEKLAYKNNNPGANAVVKNWEVAGGTRQILTNGATASLCYILGVQSVSFDGSANQCAAMNSGSIQLWGGTATNNYISGRNASLAIMRNNGYASNTVIDGGTMQIQLFGGSALNTVVKNGGKIDIVYNLGAHAYLFDTYIDSGCTLAVRHLFDEINGQTTTTHQIRLRGTTYLAGEMIFSSYTQPGKTDVDFSTLSFRRVGYRVENCGDFIFGADSRTPYDNVMVSNMNSIWKASDYNFATGQWVEGSFYVAVASDMQSGQYRLAGNARDYYENHSIYILDVDTDTEYLHTYNSQLKLGHKTFSVQLNSSDELCLMVKDVEANPDLEITDLTVSSTDIAAGTPLTLQFSLKNSGNYEAATSVVGIYDGSQLLYRINAIALPVKTSQLFTHVVDTGKMTGGTHNLRIIADIDNDVNESNEKNNETNISVQVRTKAQQADLVIDDFTVSTSSITTKENVTLNFTVKNVGTLSAPNSIVGIYDGSNYLGSVNVSAIDAGASKSYTYTISADKLTKGEHNLIVEADKDNLIAELDETNNRKSTTVQVTDPLDIDLIPYKPADNDDIIVISTKKGNHKDASEITTKDKIYIDWSVINQGKDSIVGDFYTALYLDDKFVTQWVTGELWSKYFIYIHDYELGPLSAGKHTLKIVTDYLNDINETSENNNTYTKTFYVSAVTSVPVPNVKVYSSGTLTSQGSVINSAILRGGYNNSMVVSSGGTVSATIVNSYGYLYVSSGGVANSTTVNSGGYLRVSSGGTANYTTVNSWGDLYVESGGVANSTTVNYRGGLAVYSRGVANSTTVNFGGYLYVSSGGTANSTTVNSGGYLYVSSGGTANSTTVNSGGDLRVSSGGTANYTTVNSGGYLYVFSGGTASNITAYSKARLLLTVASNTYIQGTSAGSAFEMKDASISEYTVNSGGYLYVSSGGTANSTTVNSGGYLRVSSGGTANYTTVHSRGYLYVSSDGTHKGSLYITYGANCSAYSGGIIDFTVAERTVEDGYLINDLSRIKGAPTYTITVDADQGAGTYKLAQGASAFTGTLSIGTEETAYGSITVNGTDLAYGGKIYSLDQVNGNLTLTIGGNAPVYPVITGENVYIPAGSSIDSATINAGGNVFIQNGATANNTLINSLGGLHIYSGGVATKTTIQEGGFMGVGLGATVHETKIDSFGDLTLWGGAVASNTSVGYAGELTVLSGGLADINRIDTWGAVILSSGAVGNSTTILASGGYHIYNGAVAFTTMVTSGAFLGIGSAGTVYNLDVQAGAGAQFFDKAILRGWNDFAGTVTVGGADEIAAGYTINVDAAESMINFDLTDRAANVGNIINNAAGLAGAAYYVTVDSSKASGRYYLAGNAVGINSLTITGTSTILKVGGGGATLDGNTYFALNRDIYNNLYLDIAKVSGVNNYTGDLESVDLGTWDEIETGCDASLVTSDEKKDTGILALA